MKDNFKIAELAIINDIRVDEDGLIWWTRQNKKNNRNMSKYLGCDNGKGYLVVGFGYNKKQYHIRVHHLVWRLSTGTWPVDQLDHCDRDKSNNRIENLRECSNQQNQMNRGVRVDNKLGYQNISERPNGTYRVLIYFGGKIITQKTFKTLTCAISHRDEIRHKYGLFSAIDNPKILI